MPETYSGQLYERIRERHKGETYVGREDLMAQEVDRLDSDFAPFSELVIQPRSGFFVRPDGIDSLIGKTFISVDAGDECDLESEDVADVVLTLKTGRSLKIFHEQHEDEQFFLYDIEGDICCLIGEEITDAEWRQSCTEYCFAEMDPPDFCVPGDYLWTVASFKTRCGKVDFVFLGLNDKGSEVPLGADLIMW